MVLFYVYFFLPRFTPLVLFLPHPRVCVYFCVFMGSLTAVEWVSVSHAFSLALFLPFVLSNFDVIVLSYHILFYYYP